MLELNPLRHVQAVLDGFFQQLDGGSAEVVDVFDVTRWARVAAQEEAGHRNIITVQHLRSTHDRGQKTLLIHAFSVLEEVSFDSNRWLLDLVLANLRHR